MQDDDQLFNSDATSHYWDSFRNTSMGLYLLRHEQDFIAHVFAKMLVSSSIILEIGSGTGQVLAPFCVRYPSIVSLDFDIVALEALKKHPRSQLAIAADGQRLPMQDGSVDCIVAIQCFSYFDYQLFLAECKRVLSCEGIVILQAVNQNNYKRALRQFVGGNRNAVRPTDNLNYEQLHDTLSEYGFEIDMAHGYNWVPFVPEITAFNDSNLIPLLAMVEKASRLQRLLYFSPWLLIAASKVG